MENTIRGIKNWFEAAVPEPTDKNRAVQIGCHYEEVGEMCDAVFKTPTNATSTTLKRISQLFKVECSGIEEHEVDRTELLDALCDQIVTAVGVAHMFGMDIETALAEVNASNWSKFVDGKPLFNEHGKIAKGPNYFEPQIEKFAK